MHSPRNAHSIAPPLSQQDYPPNYGRTPPLSTAPALVFVDNPDPNPRFSPHSEKPANSSRIFHIRALCPVAQAPIRPQRRTATQIHETGPQSRAAMHGPICESSGVWRARSALIRCLPDSRRLHSCPLELRPLVARPPDVRSQHSPPSQQAFRPRSSWSAN